MENTDKTSNGTEYKYDAVDVSPHKLNGGVNFSFLNYFNLNTQSPYLIAVLTRAIFQRYQSRDLPSIILS